MAISLNNLFLLGIYLTKIAHEHVVATHAHIQSCTSLNAPCVVFLAEEDTSCLDSHVVGKKVHISQLVSDVHFY